jgi:hypothetical protein
MSFFERMAEVLVEKHWDQISKLAFAMLDTHEFSRTGRIQFSGEQIRQILGAHTDG